MLFQLKAVCQFHFLDRVLWLRWSKHTHLFLSMKGLLHIKQTANIAFVVWIGTSWHSFESLAWWNASIDCRFIYFSSERLTTTTPTTKSTEPSVVLLVLVYQEWICFNLGIIKKTISTSASSVAACHPFSFDLSCPFAWMETLNKQLGEIVANHANLI